MGTLLRLTIAPLRYPVKALLRSLPSSISEAIAFETKSFVGRLFARPLRIDASTLNYLNLGAAGDHFKYFVSLDFFFSGADYGADLRYPLLIDDAVFDGIFTEHTLEHLNYGQVARVLTECFRILKPGGRIRVIVPDLSIFADNYVQKNDSWFRDWEDAVLRPRGRTITTNMEALSFVTQEYGHRSAWDVQTMHEFLARAGFIDLRKCALRAGGDQQLLRDKDDRDRVVVSLYVEATKPVSEVTTAPGERGAA